MNEGTGQLYAPALLLFLPWEAGPISPSLFLSLFLPPSLPPPLPRSSSRSSLSFSLPLVTSAPGIPRLRRHERQRRKSERASWAAKRRGVVNDSSEPRSAFLPSCSRSLPTSLSLSLSFARSFLLRRRLKTRPRAPRDPKPRENARSFARLPLAARGDHESMSYGG